MRPLYILVIGLLGLELAGCGAVLPVMKVERPTENDFRDFVLGISAHVKCELGNAVALEYSDVDKRHNAIGKWAAKVALTVRALDKGDVNPGVSVFNTAATRTLAVGGQFETNATRELTITYFWPFDELLNARSIRPPGQVDCDEVSRETNVHAPIAGNLGIHETLKSALETWDHGLASEHIKDSPFDTITHHVTFQVIAGGSATPTWKLVNVTANNTSPFLSATRTQTDDLLITMGPNTLNGRKELDSAFQTERLRSVINRPGSGG